MARATARVDSATLILPGHHASPITVDTAAWFTWLEQATTFMFTSPSGRFTARKELAKFGDRVEYIQADLSNSDWTGAVAGPFDFVISARMIHHIPEPQRIRELYREIRGLTGHGGTFPHDPCA